MCGPSAPQQRVLLNYHSKRYTSTFDCHGVTSLCMSLTIGVSKHIQSILRWSCRSILVCILPQRAILIVSTHRESIWHYAICVTTYNWRFSSLELIPESLQPPCTTQTVPIMKQKQGRECGQIEKNRVAEGDFSLRTYLPGSFGSSRQIAHQSTVGPGKCQHNAQR